MTGSNISSVLANNSVSAGKRVLGPRVALDVVAMTDIDLAVHLLQVVDGVNAMSDIMRITLFRGRSISRLMLSMEFGIRADLSQAESCVWLRLAGWMIHWNRNFERFCLDAFGSL